MSGVRFSQFLSILLLFGSASDVLHAQTGDAAKKQRESMLQTMRENISSIDLRLIHNGRSAPIKSLNQPLFRYSDQPRGILDATLWGWGNQGRPQVVCKIEDYHGKNVGPLWVYCMTSLSTDFFDAKWNNGRRFKAKKSGLILQTFSDGQAPAKTKSKRLLQMKILSRRFSSTMIDPRDNSRQEMRLLSRPISRYADPNTGLLDGALFGLASNGTNPDALFVVELHAKGDSQPIWKYGVAGMTAHALSVKLDKKEVWSKPFTGDPDDFDNWMFFSEPQ